MLFNMKPNRASASALMAPPSLSSLLHPHPHHPFSSPNPNLARRYTLPSRTPPSTVTPLSSSPSPGADQPSPSPAPPKKSFAIATGELFLGLASRLVKRPSRGPNGEKAAADAVAMFENYGGDGGGNYRERIGKVMEDEIEPEVVWEQRVKDVEAERQRRVVTSPGFSFSAAGLLFPYHLGVARFLIQNGYIKDTTPLAGSSAGAIVCAAIASGASMEDALKATKVLAEDCRTKGTAFRLGAVLRDILDKFLPDDVHSRSNGRVRVAVTQILWRPRGLLVDNFDSKEDLINAVFTSSFIPGYLAPRPATFFRNQLCIDGGLTLFMPPTSAPQTSLCRFVFVLFQLVDWDWMGLGSVPTATRRIGPVLVSFLIGPLSQQKIIFLTGFLSLDIKMQLYGLRRTQLAN
ncbi:uncharacterized protein LOC21406936 isoform X2 [Morus notabilis]|uniref:uncharacterized protein LOC21406936 isoform X2 n=1 Tax=Morus notabilis TaxID=981085 RepID=UPI000CED2AF5|nr:uncharacterized protein LOC21406936 isoform X2 [Morus notabilis]